jgi:transposase
VFEIDDLGLTRFDGHPRSGGRCPGGDVHNGDDGTNEAPASVLHEGVQAEVVELVRQPGNTAASVARDLDLTETAVREWVKQADVSHRTRDGLTSAERAELAQLRKENRVLRVERDILKRGRRLSSRQREGDPVSVFPFIEVEQAEQRNVTKTCALLVVSRSAFYQWHQHRPSPRALADDELGPAHPGDLRRLEGHLRVASGASPASPRRGARVG